jgi:hypothetical protein
MSSGRTGAVPVERAVGFDRSVFEACGRGKSEEGQEADNGGRDGDELHGEYALVVLVYDGDEVRMRQCSCGDD